LYYGIIQRDHIFIRNNANYGFMSIILHNEGMRLNDHVSHIDLNDAVAGIRRERL
jgi:hypothetical protein